MSSSMCKRCKRHVSIYYINPDTMLCRDCSTGKLDHLKPDPRFTFPKNKRKSFKETN